ncbi:MAG: hypothetical protein AAB443_04460 [Patescibacteria group bacterium]
MIEKHKDTDFINPLCSCLYEGIYILTSMPPEEGFTFCPQCKKRMFITVCKNCQEIFGYSEDDKFLNKSDMSWKCQKCKKINKVGDAWTENFMKALTHEELPKEITDRTKEKYKWVVVVFKVLIVLYLAKFFYYLIATLLAYSKYKFGFGIILPKI